MVKVNRKIHYSQHIALSSFVLIMNQRLFHTFTFFQLNPIGLFLVNLSAPLIGLAGYVVTGYSVYFHSPNYRCGPNINCNLDPLLYLLLEIVPLIMIYTVIVIFKIQFTSGGLVGFIFYTQILDALFLDVIDKSRATSQWSLTLKWAFLLIYRVPNLNFFTFDSLSFCLLKGATTLDIVAFKYTTVVCAFILVLAMYVIMNTCNVYKCHKCCKFYTRLQAQTSVIHGISTFLVMCFAQLVCSNIIPPANSRPYLWQRGHNSSIKVTVSWRHYFV